MTIRKDKAHESDGGYIVNDESNGDTIEGPYYTGGPSSPIGLDLPTSTFYVQNTSQGNLIWKKIGAGVNDWRELSAQDIPFDPTGQLNFDPTDTTVDLALQKFGGFSVSDLTEAEGFTSNTLEQTASDGWVSKTNFPWLTTEIKTSGLFSLRWFMEVGQTKATRNFGFRVLWRIEGGVWAVLSEIASSTVSRDGNTIMQSGFKEVSVLADSKIEIDVQHGQTTAGFQSIMSNVSVEVRRISNN